jgi:hypothetical protein
MLIQEIEHLHDLGFVYRVLAQSIIFLQAQQTVLLGLEFALAWSRWYGGKSSARTPWLQTLLCGLVGNFGELLVLVHRF